MGFLKSVKNMFSKKKRRNNDDDVEMLSVVKPVYKRKMIGVTPTRNHRIINSPTLRNRTNRRGRHPLGPLTPIESGSESVTAPLSRSMSVSTLRSRSRSRSTRSRSRSMSMSNPRSRSNPRSWSRSRSMSNPRSRSRSNPRSRSRSRSRSNPRSRSRSRSPLPPLQLPKSSSYSSSKSSRQRRQKRDTPRHSKRKIYRQRIKDSPCRGIKPGSKCKQKRPCKFAMGNKRQFCRKRKNTRVTH